MLSAIRVCDSIGVRSEENGGIGGSSSMDLSWRSSASESPARRNLTSALQETRKISMPTAKAYDSFFFPRQFAKLLAGLQGRGSKK
jgi:hypothetical protein